MTALKMTREDAKSYLTSTKALRISLRQQAEQSWKAGNTLAAIAFEEQIAATVGLADKVADSHRLPRN